MKTAPGGQDVSSTLDSHLEFIASSLADVPGGLDVLYEIARYIGHAPADWVEPHVDLLLPFLKHEDWWLQNATLTALTPVVADERCYEKVLSPPEPQGRKTRACAAPCSRRSPKS